MCLYLDIDQSPMFSVEPAQCVQQKLGLHADVDLHWLPRGLHPGGSVDGVTKQTISGHLAANYTWFSLIRKHLHDKYSIYPTRHNRSGVNSNSQLQFILRPVRYNKE